MSDRHDEPAQHNDMAVQRALRELRAQWQPALDADSAALDADIVARLEQARAQALQTSRRRLLAVPAVAAVVLMLALPLVQKLQQRDAAIVVPGSELDLGISELEPWQEDVELLDDLDFYTWLELEAQHAS